MNTDTNNVYMIDEKRRLYRAGVHIGDLMEDDTIKLLPDFTNYKAAVARWLRSKADEEEKAVDERSDDEINAEILEAARAASRGVGESYQDDIDFAKRTGCPMPPKKNPRFNDKTPAYVEWLEKYRLDKFKEVFRVKGRGKRAVIKNNPENGIDEVVGYEDCWMAERKCHLTEKSNDRKGLTEDMDWDA